MAAAIDRARRFCQLSKRTLIGICGEPGVGKSTFSHYLKNEVGEPAVVLPMDGFHLSNSVLRGLGRIDRKGAPDTFDVTGFSQTLLRVKNESATNFYFPIFHRDIEESIAAEGIVSPFARVIFVEGNYLLHQDMGWEKVSSTLDEVWALTIDSHVRMARLIQRHVDHGKSEKEAQLWAAGSDLKNAELIQTTLSRADFCINLSNWNPEQRVEN